MNNPRTTSAWLAAPAVIFYLFFLIVPLALLLRLSFCLPADGRGFFQAGTWTLTNYTQLDYFQARIVGFTLSLALLLAVLSIAIAYPLALFIHGLPPHWKLLALLLVLLPKLASVLVTIFGLLILLSSTGIVNTLIQFLGYPEPWMLTRNLAGTIVGELYLILPYSVVLLVLGLERIPVALSLAARGLGASSWQTFWRVTWPLSRPNVFLVGQLGLIWGLGAFLGPLILGSPDQATLAVEVQIQAFEFNNWPRAATVAVLMLFTLAFSLMAYQVLQPQGDRQVASPEKVINA